MVHSAIALLVLIALIVLLYISVELGRWAGRIEASRHPKHKLEVVTVAETSVFAILGLLIAFTFSGAYDRYEARKIHIITESNAFEKAYNYVDFFPPKYQKELHDDLDHFLGLYIAAYNDLPFMDKADKFLDQALKVEDKIWSTTVKALPEIQNSSIADSTAGVIMHLIDVMHTGIDLTRVHPPLVIFILMLSLSALGGFLIGYVASESKKGKHIHIICYILITAFTINIIFNLEYPRTGFIRLNNFDSILLDAKNHNNKSFENSFMLT